ncbi:MAG: arsenate reductase (azurin) small subunit [Deltaproteobacteria bacterium]|nr:arsenate reductase (azurin) small subunit [Deltaproteobacteria bacterium]
MSTTKKEKSGGMGCLVSRRDFLMGSGAAVATMTVMVKLPGASEAQAATVAKYPRKKIGQLSKLKDDSPVTFNYPDDGANAGSVLVKLGTKAGGGIGKGQDVVAFNAVCTHQGGPLSSSYKKETKSLGACPFHLSTFDLTRHGILISGQAYQSLPQVMLEVTGDDIYAVGVMGLIFGRHDNLKS